MIRLRRKCRYFAREVVDHFPYEVVKKKGSPEFPVRAYDCNNKFVKETPFDFWKAAFGSFVFFNALTYKVG